MYQNKNLLWDIYYSVSYQVFYYRTSSCCCTDAKSIITEGNTAIDQIKEIKKVNILLASRLNQATTRFM
ncbi:hypothetical protein [Dysgonomonas sp. ZJ709]|uniref:hypothetical protein n=1 Tax=Dysgonomonas sp. ZJ709 TaxID=2709797 RepID=UPI0013ECCB6B|nr:hypothetical protein [Dysgonomonas sp. ZJ709]